MEKIIRITMPDRSEWDVPAGLVAHNRAKYYADNDTRETRGKKHTAIYKAELKYALKNNDELIDWAENNMNWDDVQANATMHKAGCVDYQEGWVNGEKQIIVTDPKAREGG